MVMFPVPSKLTPLMVLAVSRAVAVDAFPESGPEILVAVRAPTLAVPWTSKVYPGVIVLIPTRLVVVSTNRLAVPTSTFDL
jgi:hypothetical protein